MPVIITLWDDTFEDWNGEIGRFFSKEKSRAICAAVSVWQDQEPALGILLLLVNLNLCAPDLYWYLTQFVYSFIHLTVCFFIDAFAETAEKEI